VPGPARPMFDRILVAFDASPESRRAFQVALEVAARFRSALTVATVHPPSRTAADAELDSLVPIDADGQSLSVLIEQMRTAAAARGVPSLESVALRGETVPSLIEYLNHHPHDLAVAGTRGLTRGRRLLLGSVSSGLATDAPCPVLVVRPVRRAKGAAEGGALPPHKS